MKIYRDGGEPLHEIMKAASSEQGATLLVPDLQRPYVWTPSQVTLLVDSLLRGWPFGTLLLWSVHKEELAGIPSRPFWRVADRTNEFDDQQVGKSNPPGQFRMVLDGQQRLQSLLLAFGGDAWGFRLFDHEWSAVLEAESPRGRNAKKHWSFGHLCLDVLAFRDRLRELGELDKIDFRDVLSWVVLSPHHGRSLWQCPGNYKPPIESALDLANKGRYIRLSRLWDLAPTQQRPPEKTFRERLRPLLADHDVAGDVSAEVLGPLAELMIKIVDVKQATVSFLQLSPFDTDLGGDQDVYNDAIVNIFTRLNTAGRALSRQEITFAWVKNGWGDGSKTGHRTAGVCFEELKDDLTGAGVAIDIDNLVSTVSVMWSVIFRDGNLLTAKDLLRGEKVRPMAQDLVESWGTISANVVEGAQLVHDRGFEFRVHYRSLNVLTLLLTWRLLGQQWLAAHPLSVTDKDSFRKSLDATFKAWCDRWILMSQWSGRWGKSTDKALADYAKDLARDWATVARLDAPEDVVEVLRARIANWVGELQADSVKYVDDLAVLTRNRVHEYYLPLWLWHRLDPQRWEASKVSLPERKGSVPSLDVDHVIAVKVWETLPGAQTLEGSQGDAVPTTDDFSTTMNSLGNCCLLNKSFNINKGADTLRAFLERVHDFKTGALDVEVWTGQLDLSPAFVDPLGLSAAAIRDEVDARTARMKAELRQYLAGSRQRADA
jgi:hypothetical protein